MNSQNLIKIKIDGKEISTAPGKTILDVARENGIEIPTLCFDSRLPPYGSCLLCVVEIAGINKLQLSCATEIKEGMVVTTKNDRIVSARKNALDLLVSNHYADCRGNCYEKCPAVIDVQGYLALANAGKYLEALELIRQKNPMPLTCGRVCVRYCEANCRRSQADDSVAVNFIKRYVADLEYDNLPKPSFPKWNGHKIAVVGGGPAGLTAAYFLAKEGFKVTIFEMKSKLGGMIRWGIPEYRLPEKIIDKEIQYLIDHGIEVKTNTQLGKDFSLDGLKKDGYEAIFLALGAQKAKKMGIPGEDVQGVLGGINFLEEVKQKGIVPLSGHVLVVGGGNTAIDAARTALRCKAAKVTIVYRRTREEMPADELEVEDAVAEGVELKFLAAPLEVITKDGKLQALRVQEMKLGEPDESGRRRPVPIEGSEHEIPCSTIISAIGQDCDMSGVGTSQWGEIKISRKQTIVADEKTLSTSAKGIFTGGDVFTGPSAVIDAIGAGRRAAQVISKFVLTGNIQPPPEEFLSRKNLLSELPPEFFSSIQKMERTVRRQAPLKTRIHNFSEVDKTIKQSEVKTETSRCLECGCTSVFDCELKKIADEYKVDQTRFKGAVGKYEVDRRHPFIVLDQNKCILCGKCVRLCGELIGASALGFVYRGFSTNVRPALDRPLQETTCVSCGNCIDVCPTGAIDYHYPFAKPGPWVTSPRHSVCNFCGVGCELTFNVKDEDLYFVSSWSSDKYSCGETCFRGRFGHSFLRDSKRILEAQVRKEKSLQKTELSEAIEAAAAGLRKVAEKHGPESLGFFVSPRATNEEAFLVQNLARKVFQTSNVGSFAFLAQFPETTPAVLNSALGITASTVSRTQIENADVILIINCDPYEENPVLNFSIRRAMKKGASLVTIGSIETELTKIASVNWNVKPGKCSLALEAVAAEILKSNLYDPGKIATKIEGSETFKERLLALAGKTLQKNFELEKVAKVASLIGDPQKSLVVLYNLDSVVENDASDLQVAVNILLFTGKIFQENSGVFLARNYCNSQGILDLGIFPDGFSNNDGKKISGASSQRELIELLNSGKMKGLFILGENPFAVKNFATSLQNLEFLVTMDTIETESSRKADVVFPWSALAETEGSITSSERKVQTFSKVFDSPFSKQGWEILNRLSEKASGKTGFNFSEIRREISILNARYKTLREIKNGEFFYWNDGKDEGKVLLGNLLTSNKKLKFFELPSSRKPLKKISRALSEIDNFFEKKVQSRLKTK